MQCPNRCDTPLVMSERHGVEIDYCPTCRGVWLDRGELDKILDRAAAPAMADAASSARSSWGDDPRRHQAQPKKKKKDRFEFLQDLFGEG